MLVQRAVQQEVNVLAITDHDSTIGLAEAQAAITAQALPLQLVMGVEISTCWQQREIHLIGLQIDIGQSVLQQLLAEQRRLRRQRAQQIAERLAQAHIQGVWSAMVTQFSETTALTRQHIAQILVQQHVCPNIKTAFTRYLTNSNFSTTPPWCRLQHAITAIHEAGGQAVLAHPHRYGLNTSQLQHLLTDFCSAGGDAIEVANCQQTPAKQWQLARHAKEYQLLASQGSDFHYPGHNELGRILALPPSCTPVWHQWPQPVTLSAPL